MPIVRTLLFEAARRVARNPELRAQAWRLAEREVLPRAKHAARWAAEETRRQRELLREDIRTVDAEAGPETTRAERAGRVTRRVVRRLRREE